MLKKYKTKTNVGVGVGFLLGSAAQALAWNVPEVGFLLGLVGLGFFIWGCMSYMKGKGYHPAWGLLGLGGILGLLGSILGLIVMICFRDRNKEAVNS